jgi:hypothetical protein
MQYICTSDSDQLGNLKALQDGNKQQVFLQEAFHKIDRCFQLV